MKLKYLLICLFLLAGIIHSPAQSPDTGLVLEDNAFKGTKFSQGVVFPDNLVSIGAGTFQNATAPCLNFSLSVNLGQIKANAFNNTSLSSHNVLDFSNSKLQCIETGTATGSFAGFSGKVILPQEIASRLRRNSLTSIEDNAFKGMKLTEKKTIDLSDSHKLSSMGIGVFQNSNLQEIVLPDSLEYIGNNAFSGCVDLSKITSYNPVPPALGTTVFTGVDTLSCKLGVPEEGLDAYGSADQWKAFLNRNFIGAVDPDEYERGEEGQVHVWISDDGGIMQCYMFQAWDFDLNQSREANTGFQATYKTIGIGEYEYMKENLKAIYRERFDIKFYTFYNWTDSRIKTLTQSYTPYKDEIPLSVEQFRDVYGSWFTPQEYALAYMGTLSDRYIRFKDQADGEIQQGWDLPSMHDIAQLIGQTPRQSGSINADLLSFLGASQADVPEGHRAEWYDKNKNTSGLTLTPLGTHKNAYDTGLSEELYSSNTNSFKILSKIRLKEGLNHNFTFSMDQSYFSTKDEDFVQVRYVRTKSDEELGYKLFVDIDKDSVVFRPVNEGCSDKLKELNKSLERGITLRYANQKERKVLLSWSQIKAEAQSIRSQLPGIPAINPLKECIPVTGVILDKTSLSLETGATATLSASVQPPSAVNKAVTWTSNNPAVAKVDATGKVTAVSAGTATITATTQEGGKTASCTVEVTGKRETLTEDAFVANPTNFSDNHNYIRTTTYIEAVTSVDENRNEGIIDQIQYFDGLGRPVQTVQRNITPTGQSLATYQQYDAFGREYKAWLPVALDNSGGYSSLTQIQTAATRLYGDSAFTKPVYEASPLNRVLEQYGPGQEWYAKPGKGSVKTDYLTNEQSGELSCIQYSVEGNRSAPSLQKTKDSYDTGELYVTRMTDEEGNSSYEFKDKLGQVVLTRQINEKEENGNKTKEVLSTYYVYDDFGNLCFVLPPMAADDPHGENNMDNFVYQYKYDERNRCTQKKIPGAHPVSYIYDKADRLILTQDGEQASNNEWTFSIPDQLGRTVLTGIATASLSGNPYKDKLVSAGYTGGDTNGGYTISNLEGVTIQSPLTINYYDYYMDDAARKRPEFENLKYNTAKESSDSKRHASGRGLLTGTAVATLTGDGAIPQMLYTAMYYDEKGRVVQAHSTNHLEGLDSEYTTYLFDGLPQKRELVHTAKGKASQTQLYSYEYDHARRLKKTFHKLGDNPRVLLAHNLYDQLGRLRETAPGQGDAGYTDLATHHIYNIRSWSKTIQGKGFEQTLGYLLNGNVEIQNWTQDGKQRQYTFEYDKLSRLTAANSTKGEDFSTAYSYDMHGNMKTLTRQGMLGPSNYGKIDELTFVHKGNQLYNVHDDIPFISYQQSMDFKEKDDAKGEGKEYDYNRNGAMTKDLNKGVEEISYNLLNLPQKISINNSQALAVHRYTYSAAGQKLRVDYSYDQSAGSNPMTRTTDSEGTNIPLVRDYTGNFIYEDGVLTMILLDNGYYDNLENSYYFYVRDHLGNNRVVMNLSGDVVQSNEYYPFGGIMASSTESGKQPYKYGNKELDTQDGLNLYDFSARLQDPMIPTFTSIDPLAEKYYSWSPYVYVGNNPLNAIDPDGKAPWFIPFIVKGAIGAAIDASAQVGVNMAMGNSFLDAVKNIDLTSVGASFIVGATTVPGISTSTKAAVITTTVVGDALIDTSINEGVKISTILGGEKTIADSGVDAATSVLPGAGANKLTKGINNAIVSDLAGGAARGNSHVRQSLRQAQKVVNSETFQNSLDAVGSFIGNATGETIKNKINGSNNNSIIQPADAIKVNIDKKPLYDNGLWKK